MSPERIKELFANYTDALRRLEESLREDITRSSTIIDGTIQRFEFTFELAWKLLRLLLANDGIDAGTPRAVLKEAYQAKLITEGDGWIDMLEDRNKTSHLYNEKIAEIIYQKIKAAHFKRLSDFRLSAETLIRSRT